MFPFQDKASYVCAKQECYMIYPLTGAKRKITGRVEEGKMAPERKKSQSHDASDGNTKVVALQEQTAVFKKK